MSLIRPAASSFSDLVVWRKAHQFVLEIYSLTSTFPKTELFGLVSQMRRCAVSIPANIAEGFRRRSKMDKARLLNIADSSLEECRYYLILTSDLNYSDTTIHSAMAEEVSRLLNSYTAAIVNGNKR
jgi:four helix bundle protein